MIVLAGNVACKSLGAPKDLPFVAGRTDDTSGDAWECLAYMNAEPPQSIKDAITAKRPGWQWRDFA